MLGCRWMVGFAVGIAVAGCGGGEHSQGVEATSYVFTTPTLNSSRSYSETVIDNSNTSIDIGYTETVTAVQGDGTYSEVRQSTTGSSTLVNGTNYAVETQNQSFNAQGQELRYVYMTPSGAAVTCTYDPYAGGPTVPIVVGATWNIDYNFACGAAAAITYSQNGSIVDVESVTVPAGTFTALKLQSTVAWSDSQGTFRTQTITNWRDVNTLLSVKQEVAIAVSGTLPTTGYAVSREILLESST